MADMKTKKSEREIDEVVIKEADKELSLPAEVASRAAFFARLHRERSVEDWIKRIVVERIDTEEAAFAALKRELDSDHGR
jgi:hypothetical protein